MQISPENRRRRTGRTASLRAAVATALALLVAAPLIPATAAHAADQFGISVSPAGADGKADGRSRFSYKADPGQGADDRILVTNVGAEDQAFTVVATDGFNDDRGDFALRQTEETPKDIGTWVKFENGDTRIKFTLGAGQSRLLPFTFQVPANATPGDHVGGIVASVVTPGQQVNLDRRVAVRLYTRVSGQLQPQLTISGIQAEYHGDWWNPLDGRVDVRYTISNPGNIALSSNLVGGVKTWFGMQIGRTTSGTVNEVLPGNSSIFTASVSGVPQLLYLAPYLELSPFVSSPDAEAALPVDAVSRDTFLLAMPWDLLIAIVLVVAIVLLVRWRRRQNRAQAQAWIDHVEAEAKRNAESELAGAGTGAGPGAS